MKLSGRLLQIAEGKSGLPLEKVEAYRERFFRMGFDLPEPDLSSIERDASLQPLSGPGTEFRKLIEALKIQAPLGCSCAVLESRMNGLGVHGCLHNREQLLDDIKKNAAKVSWLAKLLAVGPALISGLAFKVDPLDPIPGLFDEAVRLAVEKEARATVLQSNTANTSGKGCCDHQHATPTRSWRPAALRSPFRTSSGVPRFISSSQLMEDARQLAAMLPADASTIIGVARSGLPVATMVSMLLHRPLWILRQSTRDLVPAGHGWRLTGSTEASGPAVVIDDTVMTGNSLKQVMPIVRREHPNALFAAVYVNPAARVKPDVWVRDLAWPHLLEWNLFNSVLSPHMAVDFDGILCGDCPVEDDDDGERYLEFLRTAKPRYLTRKVPLGLVVTARLEKYRPQTEEWLARHGVQVKSLVMGPWQTKAERSKANVAAYKAEHFAKFLKQTHAIKPPMFVESDERQAAEIAKLSGGLVVCPAAGRCFT